MQYDDNVRDLFLDTDGPEPDWVQPWEPPYAAPELDRLTHLVLVDGRLVDMWSQPVTGTRWQLHADRIDRRARQLEYAASPPLPPPPPPYELMLDWLDGLVGGRRALDATDDEPLRAAGVRLGDLDPALEATDRLLAGAAERLFDARSGLPSGPRFRCSARPTGSSSASASRAASQPASAGRSDGPTIWWAPANRQRPPRSSASSE